MDTLGGDSHGQTAGVTRRQVLWGLGSAALAAGAPAAPPEVDARVVARNDAALDNLLRAQITDPRNARAGRCAGRLPDVPCGLGRRADRDGGGLVDRAAIEASRRAGSPGADSPGGAVSGALAERRGQYRPALHQLQLSARYRLRGPQRGHRGGHRENVRRRRSAARAAAVPGEGGGRNEHGRHPHAQSSLGGVFRAGAGQRRVSRSGVHAAHRAVAGGGNRYRRGRPVHRAQHGDVQHRDRPRVHGAGGEAEAAGTARPGAAQSARHDVSAASRWRSGDGSLQAPGPVRARHHGRILVPGELSGGARWRPAVRRTGARPRAGARAALGAAGVPGTLRLPCRQRSRCPRTTRSGSARWASRAYGAGVGTRPWC